MSSLVSTVTNTLAVNPTARVRGLEAFTSGHLWTPYGARGVFGGQVVAQSLMAAINTVEGKDLHSQHVGRRLSYLTAVLLPPPRQLKGADHVHGRAPPRR
jgi:hypothetical protein